MSGVDAFYGRGAYERTSAESSAGEAAIQRMSDQFKQAQAKKDELKSQILDPVEGELFRKPIEDFTKSGIQKVVQLGRKTLSNAKTALQDSVEKTLAGKPTPAPAPAEEAGFEGAAPQDAVSDLRLGQGTPRSLQPTDQDAEQALADREAAVDNALSAPPPPGPTQGEAKPPPSNLADDAAGDASKVGKIAEGTEVGSDVGGVAEGAEAIAGAEGGLNIFADLAAVGLAIGAAFLGSSHEKQPPLPQPLSISDASGF
jgi:hypothetical protein